MCSFLRVQLMFRFVLFFAQDKTSHLSSKTNREHAISLLLRRGEDISIRSSTWSRNEACTGWRCELSFVELAGLLHHTERNQLRTKNENNTANSCVGSNRGIRQLVNGLLRYCLKYWVRIQIQNLNVESLSKSKSKSRLRIQIQIQNSCFRRIFGTLKSKSKSNLKSSRENFSATPSPTTPRKKPWFGGFMSIIQVFQITIRN